MDGAIDVLVRYGYVVVFGWVFAEQIGRVILQVPDVQPGSLGWNRTATYVPDSAKPVDGSEYNPGAPEYANAHRTGPAGTESTSGNGASGDNRAPQGSNHPVPSENVPPPGGR